MRVSKNQRRLKVWPAVLMAFALPMTAPAQGPARGGPPGGVMGRGMGRDASMAADQAGFHFLLLNHGSIERSVTELPDGVRTQTTSADAEVAAQIRTHVAAMHRRMEQGRPVRRWDPLMAALFEKADLVDLEIAEIPGGIEATETSTDPETIALIQEHAKVVSGFVARGFAEAQLSHPTSGAIRESKPTPRTETQPQAKQRLLKQSAEFDRVYIPALALTNQGLQKPSLEALTRLREWLVAMREGPVEATSGDRPSLFDGAEQVVSESIRLAQAGELLKAHATLEPLREQLAARRRASDVDYPLDVLSDYHAVMEAIVKPAKDADASRLDAAAFERLRQQAAAAASVWARVEQTNFHVEGAGPRDEQLQQLESLIRANREAISRLNQALRGGDAAQVLAAAVGIKPPFAKLYMSFGDFTGLTKRASSAAGAPAAPNAPPSQLPDGWSALPASAEPPGEVPASNDLTELGKQLFFEPRISLTGTVSCNSCHNVMEGGDDGRTTSMGVLGRTGTRNSPTVWNAAFMPTQFWDGRAVTLEEQAGGPMLASPEMGMSSHDLVVSRLRLVPGYVEAFRKTFGGDDPVSIENTTKAIAAFERTLITPGSRYDRYAAGETSALTQQEARGMQHFEQVGCASCHAAPLFGGEFNEFPTMADDLFVQRHRLTEDRGRELATGDEADRYRFKTPTLRNITLTAPYLHNGSAATLEETVRLMGAVQLGEDLDDAQVADLVAFLGSLEGPFPEIAIPHLPSRAGESILPAGDPESETGAAPRP
ncbi:Cytochrome c551 peroxidase precursor [Pirellulimonas nuda]|uniref:Cytochrome c551 peroxidase n=1 Tax=Pirellulimonas nuda TaxID=2528009 RepID=A0A518DDX8_9BACT|nr:cytochrome c peroxidase [Pirellulimonas nuda]QDU89673.1 Cytochrome c551 peroxidase precursor [Pirellulimonas nuda]